MINDDEIYSGFVSSKIKGYMIREGFGKVIYSDGHMYEGQWRDDKYHGLGVEIYGNGDLYFGRWENDKK